MLKYAALMVQSSVLVPADASRRMLRAIAKRHHFDFTPRPGFLYVRSRAISSRTNDNYDEFPAEEIQKSYRTFVGKPVFVNHVNDNHRRARGVVIDAALHEDRLADGHPDTWAEVLMEIDAVRFPKLAEAIRKGRIDRTSMGTDVEYSICSHCGNRATTPAEYCAHIPRLKGKKVLKRNASTGHQEEHLIREVCYGLRFFENSVLVEPPADPTAYFTGVEDHSAMAKAAARNPIYLPPEVTPEKRDEWLAGGHPGFDEHGYSKYNSGRWRYSPSECVKKGQHMSLEGGPGYGNGPGTCARCGDKAQPTVLEPYSQLLLHKMMEGNEGAYEHADWALDRQDQGPTKYSALQGDGHLYQGGQGGGCTECGESMGAHQATCPHPTWNGHGQCRHCGYTPPTEADEECEEPYCQENNFPEGWHTKGEHMDPAHQDPGHPDYRNAEQAVRDAMGDHPLGFLLEQNEREDGTNGPSKYSKTAGVEPHDIARILDKASDSLGEEHQDDLHYVPDWEPLRKALPEHELGSWMFMNRHQHPEDHVANVAHDPALGKSWEEMEPHFRGPGHHLPKATMPAPQGLVQYKHGITRQNLTLDEHGQAWRATRKEGYNGLGQGFALAGPYHPKSLLKEHYQTLKDWGHGTETKYDEDFIADRNKRLKDAGYDVVMGQTPHSARKIAGMHGVPLHQPGDWDDDEDEDEKPWDDDEDHDEEPRATRHCTRCGEWTTRDGYHTAYDDGKCPVPSTEEREQAIYDRLHPADYCHDNCRSGHAADLARGVGSHHIFNVDEGQDASISAGPHQEPVSRQSGTYEYRNPRDQALCHYCRAPLLHPDLPSSLGRRRHRQHHHHRFVRNHPMHDGRGWVGGWGMGWAAGHPGYCCEHDSCVADGDSDADSDTGGDAGSVGGGGDGSGSQAALTPSITTGGNALTQHLAGEVVQLPGTKRTGSEPHLHDGDPDEPCKTCGWGSDLYHHSPERVTYWHSDQRQQDEASQAAEYDRQARNYGSLDPSVIRGIMDRGSEYCQHPSHRSDSENIWAPNAKAVPATRLGGGGHPVCEEHADAFSHLPSAQEILQRDREAQAQGKSGTERYEDRRADDRRRRMHVVQSLTQHFAEQMRLEVPPPRFEVGDSVQHLHDEYTGRVIKTHHSTHPEMPHRVEVAYGESGWEDDNPDWQPQGHENSTLPMDESQFRLNPHSHTHADGQVERDLNHKIWHQPIGPTKYSLRHTAIEHYPNEINMQPYLDPGKLHTPTPGYRSMADHLKEEHGLSGDDLERELGQHLRGTSEQGGRVPMEGVSDIADFINQSHQRVHDHLHGGDPDKYPADGHKHPMLSDTFEPKVERDERYRTRPERGGSTDPHDPNFPGPLHNRFQARPPEGYPNLGRGKTLDKPEELNNLDTCPRTYHTTYEDADAAYASSKQVENKEKTWEQHNAEHGCPTCGAFRHLHREPYAFDTDRLQHTSPITPTQFSQSSLIRHFAVGEFDHCVQCNKPITRVNPGGPVEWQHDATAGGVGVPHRAVPGGSPRPSEGGEGHGPHGEAGSDAAAPGGCPGGVCGITPTGSLHLHLRSLAHVEEPCEECGKPADHIHLDRDTLNFYRQIHQYTQMASEMTQHAQKRVVNLADPADLKQHMLEAHDLDDSDFWRNSHATGHPALGPDTDEDRPLTHMEIHKLHDHDHGVDEYEGTTLGDSHFHTAARQVVHYGHPTDETLRPSCGNSNPGRGRSTNDKSQVTCSLCRGTLHWKHDAWAERGERGMRLHDEQIRRDKIPQGHFLGKQAAAEPPTVSGVALKAADTGRILMLQRSFKDEKDPHRGTWEFPGGHHEDGDATSLHAGMREWEEEVGQPFPEGGHVSHVWRSGPYQGHVVVIPKEEQVNLADGRSEDNPDDPDGDDSEQVAWWDPKHARENPALRREVKKAPWDALHKAAAWDAHHLEECAECSSVMHTTDEHDLFDQSHEAEEPEEDDSGVHYYDHDQPAEQIMWNRVAAHQHLKEAHGLNDKEIDRLYQTKKRSSNGLEYYQGYRGAHDQVHAEERRQAIPHDHGSYTSPDSMRSQGAKGLVRHDIKASEVQEGDFLDIMGRTRVDLVHPNPPAGSVAFRTKTRGARSPSSQRHHPDAPLKVWRKPQDGKISTRIFSSLLRFFGSEQPEKLPGGFLNVHQDPQDYWAKPTGKAPYDPMHVHHGLAEKEEGHGPWTVARHPETRAWHVLDNQGRSVQGHSTIGHPKYELHDHEAERHAYHSAIQYNQDHGHIPKWEDREGNPAEFTGLGNAGQRGGGYRLQGTEHANRGTEEEGPVDQQHVEFHFPAPPVEHSTEDPKIAEYKRHAEEHPAPKVYPPKVVTLSSSREHGTTYRQIRHGHPDYDKPGAFHASSPEDEWHGPYRVIQHPQTKKFHVVDNQDRITGYGGREGQDEQHRAEYMRDYADGRQTSKEKAKGLAERLFGGAMDILDPGGTPESRRTERHGEALSGLMHRYQGGDHHPLHPGKFGWDDQDEEGDEQGAPYYEVKDPAGSGWKARDYGGPHVEIHHEAVGPVDTVHVAEENNRNHDVIRDPSFGHEELHRVLHNFAHGDPDPDPRYPDDIDPDTGRGHAAGPDYARNEPDIERWQKRKGYRG